MRVLGGIGSVLAALTLVAAVVASAGAAAGSKGGFTITCAWIAHHPDQARALGVGCGSDQLEAPSTVTPAANGCQYVPSGVNRIGPGVSARSTAEYSGSWAWSGYLPQVP